jgi:hypothetical protein
VKKSFFVLIAIFLVNCTEKHPHSLAAKELLERRQTAQQFDREGALKHKGANDEILQKTKKSGPPPHLHVDGQTD